MWRSRKIFSFLIVILLISVIFLDLHSTFVYATPLFSDGFECPPNTAPSTFTAWSSVAGSPTIVASPVHSGSYAMKCTATQTYVVKTITLQTGTLYGGYWFNLSALPNVGGIFELGKFRKVGTGDNMGIWLVNGTGGNCIMQIQSNYPSATYNSSAISIAVNQWHCIEWELVRSSTVGVESLYYDGVQIILRTGLDTATGVTGIDNFDIGVLFTGKTLTLYGDDAVTDTSFITQISSTAWTAAPSFSSSTAWGLGAKWAAKISLGFSTATTWMVLGKWVAKINPVFSASTSWSVKDGWVAHSKLSYATATSWAVLVSVGHAISTSFSSSTSWNVLAHWGSSINLSGSLSSSWNSLVQWTARINLLAPFQVTWNVIANHFGLITGGGFTQEDLVTSAIIGSLMAGTSVFALFFVRRKRENELTTSA